MSKNSIERNKSMKTLTPVKKSKNFTPVKVLSRNNFQQTSTISAQPSDLNEIKTVTLDTSSVPQKKIIRPSTAA